MQVLMVIVTSHACIWANLEQFSYLNDTHKNATNEVKFGTNHDLDEVTKSNPCEGTSTAVLLPSRPY